MENKDIEKLKYPIGQFDYPTQGNNEDITDWITILAELPGNLEKMLKHLSEEQLATPYRPGGWTVRQLVHHIADSHHHSYTRFKWALTENSPIIKAYAEKDWSCLVDAKTAPIELSLSYLKALHAKLVFLLNGLTTEDLERCYVHPDGNVKVSVKENIAKYAWHSRHHCAHIQGLLDRNGW